MRKLILCLAATLLTSNIAHAEETTTGFMVSEPAIACNGQDGTGHGTVYTAPPPNSAHLRLPLKIVGAAAWYITGGLPPGANGSIGLQLDRGGRYVAAGYPNTQSTDYSSIVPLIPMLQTAPGTPQFQTRRFNPPIVWRRGDALITGYSCNGGGGIQMGWELLVEQP